MTKLKKMFVMLLLASSVFMTGCDATQITEMIGKIATGVQQAMPAIRSVVDAFSNIFGNDTASASATVAITGTASATVAIAATATATAIVETNLTAIANVLTTDPNEEDIGATTGQSGTDTELTATTGQSGTDTESTATTGQSGTDTESTATTGQSETDVGTTATTDQSALGQEQEYQMLAASYKESYDKVGNVTTAAGAADIKANYGITLINGKQWENSWFTLTPSSWTSQHTTALAAALSAMPEGFRKCTTGIAMQNSITAKDDGSGYGGLGGDPIMIAASKIGPGGYTNMAALISHEMAHQFQAKNPNVARGWAREFWPNGKQTRSSVTDYGNTDFMEDMAESVSWYFTNPDGLKYKDLARYEFIRSFIWK
ncbi:MAG: hypothetical protein KKB51_03665 [Candidatus Riflebacteria bacterium]|nr:hypothetical protein [Candidatus Riflebacteria bacterium]